MNPDNEIHTEQVGNMVIVEISPAMQRVFDAADTDPKMLQLERLMDEAEDGATAELILLELAARLKQLAQEIGTQ